VTFDYFESIPRTIYQADGSLSPGCWPSHDSRGPSALSAWIIALDKVRCKIRTEEQKKQVDDLAEEYSQWIPDLTNGSAAEVRTVTVTNHQGEETVASLALTITLPEFHQARDTQILNTLQGRHS